MRPFLFVLCLFPLWSAASPADSVLKPIVSVGAAFQKGFIFAHSTDVQNTAGSYPWGFQIDINWQKRSQRSWDNCNCYPRTGVSLQYFNYDNAVLGSSFHLASYIEPYFNYKSKLTFSIKGYAGLAFLTNPYDATINPTNMSYSLPVSGYIALGLGMHYRITPRINLHTYAFYNHISNGGIKDPNKGINWPTASIGIDYSLENHYLPYRERSNARSYRQKPMRIATGFFGASKTIANGEKRRWLIGGLYIQAGKQVSIINSLDAGAEIWYDASIVERMRREGVPDNAGSAWRSGIYAGNAFVMGRFLFSQYIGIYTYNTSGYYPGWYQRYGLVYETKNRVHYGISLLAHAQVADFIDFRIGYTWQ